MMIDTAQNVLLLAGKALHSDIARKGPQIMILILLAGMRSTQDGAVVEWILTEESATDPQAM